MPMLVHTKSSGGLRAFGKPRGNSPLEQPPYSHLRLLADMSAKVGPHPGHKLYSPYTGHFPGTSMHQSFAGLPNGVPLHVMPAYAGTGLAEQGVWAGSI